MLLAAGQGGSRRPPPASPGLLPLPAGLQGPLRRLSGAHAMYPCAGDPWQPPGDPPPPARPRAPLPTRSEAVAKARGGRAGGRGAARPGEAMPPAAVGLNCIHSAAGGPLSASTQRSLSALPVGTIAVRSKASRRRSAGLRAFPLKGSQRPLLATAPPRGPARRESSARAARPRGGPQPPDRHWRNPPGPRKGNERSVLGSAGAPPAFNLHYFPRYLG